MAYDRESGPASLRVAGGRGAATSVVLVAAWALALATRASLFAQDAPEEWRELLERVVPEADRFADRTGQPPVFEAYRRDPLTGSEALVGYAFLTSDLPPEQKGFDGPIEVLVGMDLDGRLTGIVVTRYNESLRRSRGDFLAARGFQDQFSGKSIVDAFQVRRDVDGITGATITVDAMSRGIRNAAREVAVAYRLGSVATASEAPLLDPVSVGLDELDRLSWAQMLLRGIVQQILVLDDGQTTVDLTLVYLRDEAVATMLMGPALFAEVLDRAGPLAQERHLVLAGVDGPSAGGLNLGRLSVVQAGDTVRLAPEEVLLFGPPREGKLDGQVRFVRVLLFDRSVDMARPFTFDLDLLPALSHFSAEYAGERQVDPSPGETEEEAPIPRSPIGPAWTRVAAVLVLLSLAAVALSGRRVR